VHVGKATFGIGLPGLEQEVGDRRALAVVKVLSSEPLLRNFRILPLSGAQLIGSGTLAATFKSLPASPAATTNSASVIFN